MRGMRPVALLLAIGVIVGSTSEAGGALSTQAGPRTLPSLAKAKLSEAAAVAKAWRPDAYLIQVAGRGIGTDGLTILWSYGYWSHSAKTCLVVNVAAGGPTKTESGGAVCEEPELKPDFIDSDQAIKIARSNGITAPEATMIVSMRSRGKFPLWVVMDGSGTRTGNATVEIDALTGAVVCKSKMP